MGSANTTPFSLLFRASTSKKVTQDGENGGGGGCGMEKKKNLRGEKFVITNVSVILSISII